MTAALWVIAAALVWLAIRPYVFFPMRDPRGATPAAIASAASAGAAVVRAATGGTVYATGRVPFPPAPRWCGELVAHDPISGRRAPCVLPAHHITDHATTLAALEHTGTLYRPEF